MARQSYPPYHRVVRVMCSGRVDPLFVIKAFMAGADGVLVGGCKLGECKYGEGNFQALIMGELVWLILRLIGIREERFTLEWVSSAEPAKLVEDLKSFYQRIKELGPLGSSEELKEDDLQFRLSCAEKVCQNMQVRTAFGNVGKELKKLGDFSMEQIKQKVAEKLEGLVKNKLLELEVRALLESGPKSVEYLVEKTGADRESIEGILNKVVKA